MKAEVYTKPNCPYCIRAKYLLEARGVEIEELSAVDLRETLIERVESASGNTPKTVPQIFLDGSYIGGHDQLVKYFEEQDA